MKTESSKSSPVETPVRSADEKADIEVLRELGKLIKDRESFIKEMATISAKHLFTVFHTARLETHIDITLDFDDGRYRLLFEKSSASQFKPSVLGEKEEQRFTIEDMIAFAAYLHDHSWEYDYREEKTHSLLEHLDEWIKTRKQ